MLKMKKKSKNNLILGIILVGFIVGALYFSGVLNTIISVDTSDGHDVKINFASDKLKTVNTTSTFLITASTSASAKKDITLKSGEQIGLNFDDFAQISDYEDHRFDNEVRVEFKDMNITQTQALGYCNNAIPVFLTCKKEYTSSGQVATRCYCQANGNSMYSYLIGNWEIDSASTITISRGTWSYSTPISGCIKTNSTNNRGVVTSQLNCDRNVTIRGMQVFTYVPNTGDVPNPTMKMKTTVNVKLVLHKPGTYTYVAPYVRQAEQKCYGNDIYWYDSNGTVNSLIKACASSQQCVNANCTLKTYECIKDDQVICYHNNLYYMDSCGMLGGVKQTCGVDQVCLSNTKICKDREDATIVVNVPTNQTTTPINDTSGQQPISQTTSSNTMYYVIGGIFAVLIGIILWVKFGGKRK